MTPHQRGLTLIEVLMAVVLLAFLAGLTADGLRASLRALQPTESAVDITQLGAAIDTMLERHPTLISDLPIGESHMVTPDPDVSWREPILINRRECNDCPSGFSHIEASSAGSTLTRFMKSGAPQTGVHR